MATRIVVDLQGPQGNVYWIMGYAEQLCDQLVNADPVKYDKVRIIAEMKLENEYEGILEVFERYFGDYVVFKNKS